jgi:hypothetical protein
MKYRVKVEEPLVYREGEATGPYKNIKKRLW